MGQRVVRTFLSSRAALNVISHGFGFNLMILFNVCHCTHPDDSHLCLVNSIFFAYFRHSLLAWPVYPVTVCSTVLLLPSVLPLLRDHCECMHFIH